MNSVNIYLEANPNPNSLKFVADRMLLDDKVIKDYPDSKSAVDSQIARELFKFDYVERVFIMSNFITITKNEQVHWDAIKLELRNFIKKYLEEGKPVVELDTKKEKIKSSNKVIDNKIIGITCHNSISLAKIALKNKADYLAFGAFNSSKTKKVKYKASINIIRKVRKITKIPVVAIGGINSKNYKKLLLNKVNFLAISNYIWKNKKLKPRDAIKKLI